MIDYTAYPDYPDYPAEQQAELERLRHPATVMSIIAPAMAEEYGAWARYPITYEGVRETQPPVPVKCIDITRVHTGYFSRAPYREIEAVFRCVDDQDWLIIYTESYDPGTYWEPPNSEGSISWFPLF